MQVDMCLYAHVCACPHEQSMLPHIRLQEDRFVDVRMQIQHHRGGIQHGESERHCGFGDAVGVDVVDCCMSELRACHSDE